MKVMHMISGGDSGGAKTHLFALLDKLKLRCDVVVACLMQGVFYEEILEKDIETLLFEQKNRFDLSVLTDIKKYITENGVDILHVHGARANFIAFFLKKHLSIPIVTTMHSDYRLDFDSFYKKLIFTTLNKISLRKIDYFIAVSDNFKNMLIERGFRPNNIHTVYNGMDFSKVPQKVTSREDFAQKYNLPTDDDLIYVGIAARFDLVKGVDVFIKGAAKAYESNKNLRFLIAGSGVEEDNLRSLVESLGMKDVIKFLGFVTDIYGFLNFIDINTLTSHNESFPYSMLEGCAMRRPMVASCVGGIPDLVTDGDTGYLFEKGNSEQFAQKLIQIAENDDLRKQMGENIYVKATTRFSSDAMADDHVEIYKSIINDYRKDGRYDFVLSGYYGFKNSGDDALLLALINDLKEKKEDVRIAVLSSNPMQTKKQYRVDSFGRVSPQRLARIFKNSKVLLSGGGSLIQDKTSSKSLWYYLFVIAYAKMCGMKVMQIASGIGPVNRKFNRKLTGYIINKNVDFITLREENSLDEIKSMGIKVPTKVTADPALTLIGVNEERVAEIFRSNNIPFEDYVCVSLRHWKGSSDNFEDTMADVLDYVAEKYCKNIVFVPMQYPVDIKISNDISAKMKNPAYVIEDELSIREVIGVINGSDLVMAMRLHSLVYAVSCGVGIIALKYDPKIEGFADYFQQKYIADVSNADAGSIIKLVDDYFANSSSEQLETLCREMKTRAAYNGVKALELLKD